MELQDVWLLQGNFVGGIRREEKEECKEDGTGDLL